MLLMGARYQDGIRALRSQRCFDNRGLKLLGSSGLYRAWENGRNFVLRHFKTVMWYALAARFIVMFG